MKPHIPLVAALAALVGAPVAAFNTTGSAAISDLQFELVDLDASDGVAPSLAWLAPRSTNAEVSSAFGSSLVFEPGGTWVVSFPGDGIDSKSDLAALLAPLNASFGASAASTTPSSLSASFQTASNGSSETAFSTTNGTFTLTQMTTLRVTGKLDLSIFGPSGNLFTVPAATPADYAVLHSQSSSYAALGLSPRDGGGDSTLTSFDWGALDDENYTPSTDPNRRALGYSDSASRSFELLLVNDSADSMTGEFFAQTLVSGQQIQAIPEPGAWMSLSMGLVLLALRRRNGHSKGIVN